ncbi:MAG: TlpA family protein disulfide reductase [Bacteroidota bacterium]
MARLLHIILVLLLTSIGNHLLAENTVIKGEVKNGNNKEIKIIQYADYISMKKNVIASTRINDDGSFHLKFFLPKVDNLKIGIGFKQSSLFVEPGSTTELSINYGKRVERKDGFFPLEQPLDVAIENERDTSVNKMIMKFDSLSGVVLPENRIKMILYQRNYSMYDSLKSELNEWINQNNNRYVKNYADYRLGQLETAIYSSNMRKTGEELLGQRQIKYRHQEYMSFFKKFVSVYLPDKSKEITHADLVNSINKNESYSELDEALGKDTLFRNEQIRELVAITLLEDVYYEKDYIQDHILELLDQLSQKTKFDKHKQIISRLSSKFKKNKTKNGYGQLRFVTENGDSVRFYDYRGRYFLVSFFQSDCFACILEMDVMKKLYDEHKNDVYLLSISLDEDYKAFEKFVRSNDYSWDIAHFGHQYEITEKFDIPTIPRFILFGPDGEIIHRHFPKLSEGGLKKIYRLLDRRRKH